MAKVIGDTFISDNGIRYSLYEGISIDGSGTSDIIFIMFDDYPEETTMSVSFLYGATFIRQKDTQCAINESVCNFEINHPEIVEKYGIKKKKYHVVINCSQYAIVEVEATSEEEAKDLAEEGGTDIYEYLPGTETEEIISIKEVK